MQERLKPFTIISTKTELEKISKRIIDSQSVEVIPLEKVLDESLLERIKKDNVNPFQEIYENFRNIYEFVEKNPEPKTWEVSFPTKIKKDEIIEFSKNLTDELHTLSERISKLKEEEKYLENNLNLFDKLQKIQLDVKNIQKIQNLKYKVGKISSMYYERLFNSIKNEDILVLKLNEDKDFVWLFIVYDSNEDIEKTLSIANFVEYEIPKNYSGTPSDILKTIQDQLKAVKYEIEIIEMSIKKLFYEKRRYIYEYSDYVFVMKNIYDLVQNISFTEDFFIISGWTDQATYSKLFHYCNSNDYSLLIECSIKEKQPTLLKNRSFFKHFEFIVKMFSTPSSDEIDPTPIISILFLFFFGMMFGDIGHGLVLTLLGFLIYKKSKSDLFYVLGASGISSMIFGTLYGSFFGFENIIKPLWKRPMDNINYFLLTSIYFGIAVITLAMILNIFNKIKNKQTFELLFDPNGLSGIAFYWIVLGGIFYYMRNGAFPKISIGFIVALIVAIYLNGIIFEKGKLSEKAVQSFFELFESLLGYLSNTLSFIRLGAFALNHAGLFLAFYMMSQMASNSVVSFVILLLGNILIIGLEGLVVFIQTLRLDYYEFFTRFFKGNGKEFNPVKYKF
ncbi:ATPase [Petrotoga mexicana DSM 14811]|jgi:V/A-type H+-transporting ATPase subunit I|uniref:ATPase n=1 Tax=Petrotoga mexicana DSM 14811 TaxID=1122954 RepID=A0A2K1PD94_9BACT|nr:V-type ATPase 116kDa subunit family protein [Petrotoga mexicana]PNS00772.1 ATPase [Petrotoga mexicana DSM 14811]